MGEREDDEREREVKRKLAWEKQIQRTREKQQKLSFVCIIPY